MPGSDVTLGSDGKSTNLYDKTINYYLETLEGAEYTDTKSYQGKTYYRWIAVENNFNYLTYKEEYFPITGFTQLESSWSNGQKKFDWYGNADLYYTRNSYDLQFYDGTKVVQTKSVKFEDLLTKHTTNVVPDPPAGKEDCKFGGWYIDPQCTKDVTGATMPANKLMVYAKWIAQQYTVTVQYVEDGETKDATFAVDKNSTLDSQDEVLRHIVKSIPDLRGFYVQKAGEQGTPINYPYVVDSDVTLIAEQDGVKYSVQYDHDVVDENTYPNGVFATVLPCNKDGFDHWKDASGATYYPGQLVMVTPTTSLTAVFVTVTHEKTTLTYRDGNGKTYVVENIPVNGTQTVLSFTGTGFTEPDGQTFAYWVDSEGTHYAPNDTILVDNTGDNTLTAVYTEIKCTVTFDSKGGSDVAEQTVEHGAAATEPANPTKNQAIFTGWNLGDATYDFSTPVTGNITLVAQWDDDKLVDPTVSEAGRPKGGGDGIADKYQITVNYAAVNGTVTPASTVVTKVDTNGEPAEDGTAKLAAKHLPTAQATEGYGNGSWDKEPKVDLEVTDGEKLTITYELNSYTITVKHVNAKGKEVKAADDTTKVDYGKGNDVTKLVTDSITGTDGKNYVKVLSDALTGTNVTADATVTATYALDVKPDPNEDPDPTKPGGGIPDMY